MFSFNVVAGYPIWFTIVIAFLLYNLRLFKPKVK